MKNKDDLSLTEDALVTAYVDVAVEYGSAIDAGDYRTANRRYDAGLALSSELRKRGTSAERRIFALLAHENPWVQYWAATDVLKLDPSEAEPVLDRLARLPSSPVRLSAETLLSEWRTNRPYALLNVDRESLRSFPRRVAWDEVTERDRFDDRFGAVNVAEGAIMDVGDDGVELTTDDQEPTHDQLVAWAWLVRPDLGPKLREIASREMREAIDYYEEEKK